MDGGSCNVEQIEFEPKISVVIPKISLVQAAKYQSQPSDPDDSKTFVELGRWQGQDNDVLKELIFAGIPKKPNE